MKKQFLWMLFLAMVLGLASCSEKDNPSSDNSTGDNLADVTVMIYGSGDGSLDKNMVAGADGYA